MLTHRILMGRMLSLFREVAESQFQMELDNAFSQRFNSGWSWIMPSPRESIENKAESQLQMELDNNFP